MATRATLINPETGEKRVVEAGSPESKTLFNQGFYLMGAGGKPVGYTPGASVPAPVSAPPAVQTASTSPATAPNQAVAAVGSQTPPVRQATLFGPAGERVVVDAGSTQSKELFGRGFTLTQDEAKKKQRATLVGPNGERRVVFVGSDEDIRLRESGYGERAETNPVTTSGSARAMDEPVATPTMTFDEFKKSLEGNLGVGERPVAPDYSKEYTSAREQYGVPGLEQDVAGIDAQIRNLDLSFQQGENAAGNKLKPMELIRGEQGELYKQYQFQRQGLLNERATKVDQLTTATNIVAATMDFLDRDYDNALAAYNDAYAKSMQAFDLFNQYREDEDRKARQRRADASANLTTFLNMMQDSGKQWDDLDPAMRASIEKLELQSGLPRGTIRAFNQSNLGKLFSTTQGTDAAGNDIVSFIYADKNGNPGVVHTVKTGGVVRRGSGSGREPEPTSLRDQLQEDFDEGMSYEEANALYPEFKGSVIDKLYGIEKSPLDKARERVAQNKSTTAAPAKDTLTQGKNRWWMPDALADRFGWRR